MASRQIDGFSEKQVAALARLRYAFSVWFPPQLLLRKEWGECLIRMGTVGSALTLFEVRPRRGAARSPRDFPGRQRCGADRARA